MVRIQNVLATVWQSFSITCLITICWLIAGYSLAFTPIYADDCSNYFIIGDLHRAWLVGVSLTNEHELAHKIPESLFCMYELTFAIITPALICGAFADRMEYISMLLFMILWHFCVYCFIAHWQWHPCGFLYGYSLDFAGGNVVHLNAGMAGLICALIIGNRTGYGKERYQPHNVLISVMGACMLWVGWFGFNAGSFYEASTLSSMSMLTTQIATACAGISWMLIEAYIRGRPSVLGMVSGAIAGLICITPAAGFVDPTGVNNLIFFDFIIIIII